MSIIAPINSTVVKVLDNRTAVVVPQVTTSVVTVGVVGPQGPTDPAEPAARIAADTAEASARVAADLLSVLKAGDTMTGPLLVTGASGNQLVVDTNSLVVDATNHRVGIGTTAPSEQLELTGNLCLASTSSVAGIIKVGANRFIHNFGTNNSFLGVLGGNLTLTGVSNSGVGAAALGALTTGSNNVAMGVNALAGNTTGSSNVGIGVLSGYSTTTGANNLGLGTFSLYGNTTGSWNVGVGYNAGRYIADGVTANQTSWTSVYIGASTRASVSGDTNEVVIGYDAIGNGSNSVTIGNASITKSVLQGSVGIGTPSPNANALLDVVSTTKAFMPPRMTTTQKNAIASPTAGMVVYDSTLNKLAVYTTAWETVSSS